MRETPIRPGLQDILRWLRWPNLLIVCLTLLILRYSVLDPLVPAGLDYGLMDPFDFSMLILLTCMITVGGYIINDYFDQGTDAINKMDKRAVGIWISPGNALGIYLLLTLLGAVITLFLALVEHKLQWVWIYPLAILLLWWYSKKLKSTVLWGNLLVSLFCSGVALLVPFAEMETISILKNGKELMTLFYAYALFAGLSNLLREVVKDAEDRRGDELAGLTTYAVKYGTESSRKLALTLVLVLSLLILAFVLFSGLDLFATVSFAVLCGIPLLMILGHLLRKGTDIQWHLTSTWCKVLMLNGLIALLFF